MTKEQKQIAIVGGGAVGLCCAYYLAKDGHQITIIDRDPPLNLAACSLGNAGMIVPSHFIPLAAPGVINSGLKWMLNPESPFYIRPQIKSDLVGWLLKFRKAATTQRMNAALPVLKNFGLESRQAYDVLDRELGLAMERNGLLMLCATQHGLDEELAMAQKAGELGIATKHFRGDELRTVLPEIEHTGLGAILYPNDAHLHPHQLISRLYQALQNEGVRFHHQSTVSGFEQRNNELVSIKFGEDRIVADEFILAAGIWSTELCRQLDLNLPMQGGKGYSVTAPASDAQFEVPLILVEGKVAVTPLGDELRIGGTMELDGLNSTINQRRLNGILKSFDRFFPGYDLSGHHAAKPWYGFRPVSPDGLPYIGRVNAYRNLTVATGHAMMGISLAPATGQYIQRMMAGEKAHLEPLFNPSRYN